jgi:ubiquinone/menaquinone biosynthesis C-methylase UbiE
MGSGKVVGIDISEKMLARAKEKSVRLGAKVRLIRSDVFDAPTNSMERRM